MQEMKRNYHPFLSHELAHLSQRHFARNVLRGRDTNLASSLVMVSAIALAIVSNNPTAMMAGPAALAQQQLRYSRIFETRGRSLWIQ